MINQDRIVPVTATDLLTLYGNILSIANISVTALEASGIGEMGLDSGTGNYICSEPLKKFVFGSTVTSATIYFIPSYDYDGFSKTGATLTIADNGVVVDKDGSTLYKAVLSTNTLTITKVGF